MIGQTSGVQPRQAAFAGVLAITKPPKCNGRATARGPAVESAPMNGALLSLLLLAVAAWAHLAFWSWRLRLPGAEDELLYAFTADGFQVALGHRRPRAARRGPPVLLLHGLAVNRLFMDFGAARHSLSAHLAAAGFDCYALDLRGHGASPPGPSRDWTFDDYLLNDLPAALAVVRDASGGGPVALVGHSQGALLALAAATLYPDEVAAVVALAGPVRLAGGRRVRGFTRLAFAFRHFARFLARMVAPLGGLVHSPLLQASMNTRNVERPVLRRLLANAVEDVPDGVARQFTAWIERGAFDSADGAVDYRAAMSRARQPALFVAAERDGLAPPPAVRAGLDAWGGEKDYLLAARATGFSADYGHGDLIFGRRAPEEVFPRISGWLLGHPAAGRRARSAP